MIANYHTHTHRCNHAIGREEEYVQEALKAGLKILGWADHTPYLFPGGYYSHFRMRPVQLPGYIKTIQELQKQYAGQIEMPIGLETEYYPKHFGNLMEYLRDHPIEYLILGQHFIGNEVGDHYCGWVSGDRDSLNRYCRQVCEAMETGLFTYFAHPDLIHFIGDEKIFRHHMRDICREARSCGVPLEFNLLGLAGGRHYPTKAFWELAAEEGCAVILGRDAHSPEALLDEKTEKKALGILAGLGIQPVEKVNLQKI